MRCRRLSLSLSGLLAAWLVVGCGGTAAPTAATPSDAASATSVPTPAEPTKAAVVPPLYAAGGLRVVYQLPGMEKVDVRSDVQYIAGADEDLKMDVYYPTGVQKGAVLPAVLFVHGSTSPKNKPKNLPPFVSWGQLIAASGLVGVTFNWRYPSEDDIQALIQYLRTNADSLQIDKDRLCVFAFSAGVPYGVSAAMRGTPEYIRCMVAYYGEMGVPKELLAKEQAGKIAPILIAKAGKDDAIPETMIDVFVREATAKGVSVDLLVHPTGVHAFDLRNDDEQSGMIIKKTIEFIKAHLTS